MTQLGLPDVPGLSIALVLISAWILNRAAPKARAGSLLSAMLVLAATYLIAQLGVSLSAPH